VFGVLVTGLAIHALQARTLPDLAFWHENDFAESVVPELDNIGDASWQDYLDHEALIFDALAAAVQVEGADLPFWHRYHPERYQEARRTLERWNRSSLLTPASANGAALLVHGLSDSPYSMHALSDALYRSNLRVLNLRVPGHGTVPGALDLVSWRDFRAAYDLGVRTLVQSLPEGEPLVLVGYSNGSSLAVDYTLRALASGGELRRPDQLILVSPAMRVSPLAALAWVQKWMAELPGLEKLNWTDILPEYDPYKYNSFPLSAGQQIYGFRRYLLSSRSWMPPYRHRVLSLACCRYCQALRLN
jgi:pimeloyl-ACP methyl ester carboxylesterase